MSADSGGGSFSRARRFGGWNSDSPPGLTATPNGGGGTCGTRRGSGGGDPAVSASAASRAGRSGADPRAWPGSAPDRLIGRSWTPRDELTVSENTDPAGAGPDDPRTRGGENQEYG